MSLLGRLKTAIKGNPVLKEYDLGRHVGSAGPGLLWKVYDGIKKTNKKEVSLFIFYKQVPEMEKISKKDREALFEMLKRGPTHLARLRHPKVLTIDHPVEETSDCIAFATEPVFTSLANILGHYDNLPSPLPLIIKEYQLHTLEAHYGLLMIAEALQFLHNDVNMIHGNITPENIIISRHGDWKLAGFNFATFEQYQTTAQTTFQFKEYDSRGHTHTNPSLDYIAPEYLLSQSCTGQSDLYSYGMLAYAVYNGGKPLYENHDNTLSFKHNIERISRVTESGLGDTPLQLRSLIRALLVIEPSVRPDALQITKHEFFEDVLVSTLKYLDSLYEKSDIDKSQWFKSTLGKLIMKIPKRIVHQRILPRLSGEFRNHKMIPFILPIILLIADDCTMQEYSSIILPVLIPVFKIHNPIQIPLIFLQKMDLLLKKTSPDEMKKYILPMILATLESDNSQVQELCVSIIPTFSDMVDYTSLKHSIVPRIISLCLNTSSISLQVKSLVSLGVMLESLDKHIVMDQVLPAIIKIPSKEPGVLMGILGIFHKTMTTKKLGFDKQFLATKVLPYLIPLSMEPSLNISQFNQFMLIIKDMIKKMENEQQHYLQQVSKMEENTKSTIEFAREVSEAKAMEDTLKGIENLGGGGGGTGDVLVAKAGSVGHKHIHDTMSGGDMFTGLEVLSVTQTSPQKTKTTPTLSGMKKINFNESESYTMMQPPIITNTSGLGTWEVPTQTQPNSSSGLFSGLSMNESLHSSPNSQTRSVHTSKPVSNSTGMGISQRIQSHSMGTGMLQPTSTNPHSHDTGIGLRPVNNSMGTGILQPMQPGSNMGTGMLQSSNEMGMGLRPVNNMGMGITQPLQNSGMGILQPTQTCTNTMGLQPTHSGMGMGILQPTKTHSETSTSGIGSQPTSSMGILQPSQSHSGTTNIGMGWSSNIGTTVPQNSGWSSSLHSSQTGLTGFGTGQTGYYSNEVQAPGDNPFADFNSLL